MDNKEFKINQLQVGEWKIIPEENCLVQDEQEVLVIPKVMQLLLYFTQHPNQVLSIQQLSQAIWPSEYVGDNAIYNMIGQLRKALRDNASQPIYIETISKKGYRLIAEVSDTPAQSVSELKTNDTPKTSSASKFYIGLSAILLIALGLFLFIFNGPKPVNQPFELSLAKQLHSLGEFQFNKGQLASTHKAVEYFQESLAIAPNDLSVLLDLGFAYYELSKLAESQHDIYRQKANALAKNVLHIESTNPNAQILLALTDLLNPDGSDVAKMNAVAINLSHRALTAISWQAFRKGNAKLAVKFQTAALAQCSNCAYIYKALATSKLVAGDISQGFSNFQTYLELSDSQDRDPSKGLGYQTLNIEGLRETNRWLKSSDLEFSTKHSIKKNPLALFYLSMRKTGLAQQIMQPAMDMPNKSFFTLYTLAALAGAQGDFAVSHQLLLKRMYRFPGNKRFSLPVAYTLWMQGEPEQALQLLQEKLIRKGEISAKQYRDIGLIQLYAVLLKETGEVRAGNGLLLELKGRYEQGLLASSEQGAIGYAQILAALEQNEQAITEIEIALNSGWVEDFNKNWWYLEHDPFFRSITKNEKFMQLVDIHCQKIAAITEI